MKCAQVPSENGRTRSTWLNYNYFQRNNKIQQQSSYPRATPFSTDKGLLSVRGSSPTSWGEFKCKESPVLPIPSYPALCREDTTSWNHGRPRTHTSPAATNRQLHPPISWIHTCLPCIGCVVVKGSFPELIGNNW